MRKELLNTQIEALSVEHGAQIVEFYRSNGFDTRDYEGKSPKCYYGVDDKGLFYCIWFLDERKTITLEQAKQLVAENDLYTEITAYKLTDGTIVESKEDAEMKAKEYKIAKELQEVFEVDKAMFIYDNLELIKAIINQ